MNRRDFLRMLENELNVLDRVERKEILDFYEERFHTGTNYEGKTEEEIIAELEHPKAIARNVLDEYGVSPKFVKKKEERYDNVNVVQAIFVIAFDVIIASWLIPTLFSVFISLIVSSFTWVTTLPLVIGVHTIADQYMFALLTGAYILLFFASLLVLEMLIWTVKKVIIWHLNVFKIKKRERFIKKASSISVDKFLKNHKGLRFFKNIAVIASIVAIAISGFWVVNNYEVVEDNFTNDLITETHEYDFTSEIAANEEWNVNMKVDLYDINVEYIDSNTFEMTHSYYEKEKFEYTIDEENNEIYVNDVDPDFVINDVHFSIVDLFELIFQQKQQITLYLPQDLILDDVSVRTEVGDVNIQDLHTTTINVVNSVGSITANDLVFVTKLVIKSDTGTIVVSGIEGLKLDLSTSTGRIALDDVKVNDLDANVSTGRIEITDSIGTGETSTLNATSNTGRISVYNADFDEYVISGDTGSIVLTSLNTANKDGNSLEVSTDTGNVTLSNVFVANVDMGTDTGNIEYKNPLDPSFVCNSLVYDTDTGNSSVLVGSAN